MTMFSPEVEKLLEDIKSGRLKMIDSVHSPLTKKLVAQFGAVDADITDLWMPTPQHWICPGCGRNKEQIVRLNKHNQLMCRLVEHHDHMKDLLLERFRVISAAQAVVVADEVAESFAKRSVSMVSSYDNTVICCDCNSVDVPAKKAANAHSKFSFSVGEIREFVISKPNQAHEFDANIAIRIWKDSAKSFARRLEIVDMIAEIAATDTHWYQQGDWQCRHESIVRASKGALWEYKVTIWPQDALRGETKKLERDYSQWRRKTSEKIVVPTNNEVDVAAKVTSSKPWSKVDADWHCPVCQRIKHETVRKNNDGKWSFTLADKWYRDPSETIGKKHYVLCNDCGWVAQRLAQEAAETSGTGARFLSSWVEVDEIAAVILPRAHGRHLMKNDEADIVVSTLVQRIRDELHDTES